MIVPERQNPTNPHPRTIVNEKLTLDFLTPIIQSHLQTSEAESLIDSLQRAFTRYELDTANLPSSTKKEKDREWAKIENAASRLLNTLDELSNEVTDELKGAISLHRIERLVVATPKNQSLNVPEPKNDLSVYKDLAEILHICKQRMDKQKTVSPPSPYQLDTPLNNLIRECFGLWSEQSSAYGIHYNSVSGQYGGEFYEFVKALFEHYFPKSAYQSDQALGKRIKRVMNARRGKDIG